MCAQILTFPNQHNEHHEDEAAHNDVVQAVDAIHATAVHHAYHWLKTTDAEHFNTKPAQEKERIARRVALLLLDMVRERHPT